MAEYICYLKKENAMKAEDALRKDFDTAAKQSITVKAAAALGMKLDGSFIFIRGDDRGIAHCKELIKGFVEKAVEKDLAHAKREIEKEEDAAAAGMGGIFG